MRNPEVQVTEEKRHEKMQDKLRTNQGVGEISAQMDMKITIGIKHNYFFCQPLGNFLTLLIPIRDGSERLRSPLMHKTL